jgi:hypothetical protein
MEARFAVHNYDPESDAVNEVLSRLDTMDMNLTTDITKRRMELREIPFYAPFCG